MEIIKWICVGIVIVEVLFILIIAVLHTFIKDAEEEYPTERIEEAFALAVKSNARKWSYVEAILKRWKEEGYGKKQDRQNNQEDRRRDIQRKVDEFLNR